MLVPLARLDETLVEAAFLATGTNGQSCRCRPTPDTPVNGMSKMESIE